MSVPKVVRTTYYQDMDYDGFPVGTPVVILPAADYDRMVERERDATKALRIIAEAKGSHWASQLARAFLTEHVEETSDGK